VKYDIENREAYKQPERQDDLDIYENTFMNRDHNAEVLASTL